MKIVKLKIENCKGGYTIIETMIAISLFLVIIMAGMGALLNANLLHQKSQNMRSIIDNLSFIMEDMSRNLRTGSKYHCVDDGDFLAITPHSCGVNGGGISFKSASGLQWVYKIESTDGGLTFDISKSVDGGTSWVQLNPDEIIIDRVSSFTVLGAEAPAVDNQQPFVSIHLVGKIVLKNNVSTPFSLQTSASQRLVDI